MPSAFFSSPAAGGIVLIIASAAAIIVANSPLREGYEVFLKYNAAGLSVEHWINDALMAVFFMMVGLETERVMQGLQLLESQASGQERTLRLVADYSMPNVSEKVARIIHSYRDYVMRTVWKQY